MTGSKGMLAAKQPLVVPMLLRLSHFKLNSYVVLVVSKQKGITLVFKTDPLQNVDINSTFDSIAVIQKFIKKEIESQLRQMFREDLPGIIHRLSQQWVKAKVEAPYLKKRPLPPRKIPLDTLSLPDFYPTPELTSSALPPPPQSSSSVGYKRSPAFSGSAASRRADAPTSTSQAQDDSTLSFPELENFDPTYGLRPEGLPTKSLFNGFSSLFAPNKGLADLAEEVSEEGDYDDEAGSFDIVDWENTVCDNTPPPTISDDAEDGTEYETVPAVGGGTITRPRVYHSQSLARAPSDVAVSTSRPTQSNKSHFPDIISSIRNETSTEPTSLHLDSLNSPHISEIASRKFLPPYLTLSDLPNHRYVNMHESGPHSAPLYSSFHHATTTDNSETRPSQPSSVTTRSIPTPSSHLEEEIPPYTKRPASDRRLSHSSSDGFHQGSPPTQYHADESDPKIVLRPTLNNSIHQLSTLSHSNHTLSPYTRSVEHFTVRSVPPRGVGPSGLSLINERQPVKARRKRTYRLRETEDVSKNSAPDVAHPPLSGPPSEFDASDIDRYFRSHDSLSFSG